MVIALNKIDRVEKPELLPIIEVWGAAMPGTDVVPVSARRPAMASEELERA